MLSYFALLFFVVLLLSFFFLLFLLFLFLSFTNLGALYHRILLGKLCKFNLPTRSISWIIDFLSNRPKLSEGCYSEWG